MARTRGVGWIERSVVERGISPEAVSQHKGQEIETLLLCGDALLCQLAALLRALSNLAESSIVSEQIGVIVLPVSREGLQGYSCAGDCNLVVDANKKTRTWLTR